MCSTHLSSMSKILLLLLLMKRHPLKIETNPANETLNQNGRQVDFFTRTLTEAESNHSAVEKSSRHYRVGSVTETIFDW